MAESRESRRIAAADTMTKLNALFSATIFIGFGMTQNSPANNINSDPKCIDDTSVAVNLVMYHVYAFGSFVISGGIAFSINTILSFCTGAIGRSRTLRLFMVMSGIFYMSGSSFMLLAITNLIQIKLGMIDCVSSHTVATIFPLLIGVPIVVFISTTLCVYAFNSEQE